MANFKLGQRLALGAIVNGLRAGGEVSEKTIKAIAAELRSVAHITDEWGHAEDSTALRKLADDVEAGKSGE